jgi:hypothetical protein
MSPIAVDTLAILKHNWCIKAKGAVGIEFEWDPGNAASNLRKHGVSLREAASVFQDDLSISVPDPDHST